MIEWLPGSGSGVFTFYQRFEDMLEKVKDFNNFEIFYCSVVDPDPDPDPELFAGSGSGINSFGSGSYQYLTFPVKKSHFLNQMHKKSEYLAHIQYI